MTTQSSSARLRPFRPVPFGRYTLLAELAKGGMGEIFLARLDGAQGFEKLCVIKKILPQLASERDFAERFVNEAKTLVKLTHGSIAQVLDMGVHEGEPYIALEHVDGKDLRKVAARMRDRQMPIPLTVVLYVMSRVLDALAYAHRKRDEDEKEIGLVHRDISPQNILVSYEGEVKVIDFGLAKSTLNHAKTNPSIILGKFLYMSPEQARHTGVDRRSDLYSVGICLYELIHGKNPFDDAPAGELMSRVTSPQIPPLLQVEPLCPPTVAQVVSRALQPDPAHRFQTAEELRAKLLSCLLDIDPSAGPESVSRFMREAFASEYQAERRLLATLRESLRTAGVSRDETSISQGLRADRPSGPKPEVSPVFSRLRPPYGRPPDGVTEHDAPLITPGEMPAVGSTDVTMPRASLPPMRSSSEETQPRAPLIDVPKFAPPGAQLVGQDTLPRALVPEKDTDPRAAMPPAAAPAPEVTWPRAELPSPDVTRPRAEVPSPDATRPWAEMPQPPWAELPSTDETRPRAEMPQPPRSEVPPPDAPRPRPEMPPPPPRTQSGETQPRVLLGTLLGDPGGPSDPAWRTDPSGVPPPSAREPAALGGFHAESGATMELQPPELPPPPRQPAGRSGWFFVVPIVLVTLGSVAYFVYDMHRSGVFLAEPGEVAPRPSDPVPIKPPQGLPVVAVPTDPALAAAQAADGGMERQGAAAGAPDASVELAVAEPDLEPLTPPTPVKKIAKRRPPKPTPVSREWSKARAAFEELERSQPCEMAAMALLCTRYLALKSEVERGSDDPDHMLARIRAFENAVAAKRGGY